MKKFLLKYKTYFIILLIILIILGILVLIAFDDRLKIKTYKVSDDEISNSFNGLKIAQISDLHGIIPIGLKDALQKQQPDMIALTGDIIDEYVTDLTPVYDFLMDCCNIAPTYYVSGNHEIWRYDYEDVMKKFEECGVKVLDNKTVALAKQDDIIYLTGISDPNVWDKEEAIEITEDAISSSLSMDGYNILLFHRADLLDCFNDANYDLILSGHLHGGQINIPFIGGLISPDMVWMPDYSGGKYKLDNDSIAIVSRGLANTTSVPRLFNRPELVIIELHSDN